MSPLEPSAAISVLLVTTSTLAPICPAPTKPPLLFSVIRWPVTAALRKLFAALVVTIWPVPLITTSPPEGQITVLFATLSMLSVPLFTSVPIRSSVVLLGIGRSSRPRW